MRAPIVALILAAAVSPPAASGAPPEGLPPDRASRESAPWAPRGYVGAAACGACHAEILESWRRTAHARASDRAVLGNDAGRAVCLTCHATGEGASPRRRLPGVQCEACHGPGGHYAVDDVMRDPFLARALGLRDLSRAPEVLCARCHRDDLRTSARPFVYAEAWRAIAH